jgi:hypothetical protein
MLQSLSQKNMYKLFNNILVPLSVDRPCEMAIEKALELSVQFKCDVHLLYLLNKPFWKSWSASKDAESKAKMSMLRDRYAAQLPKGCMLHVSVREGNAAGVLAQYITVNHIDLILAHKQLRGLDVDIDRLAANTGCPVLSLQINPRLRGIKNIVLPVSDQLPLRKIMLAIYMAKDSNAAIHLISLSLNNTTEQRRYVYLEKAYQLLRENTTLPIRCRMMIGENIADTTLEYARNVAADLILVKAGDESLLSGPMARLFPRWLSNRSDIPVITVA